MKKDIDNRTDIELLVNTFCEKVMADRQPGFIFGEIDSLNWCSHLPAMYDFWENIILFTGGYEGSPMNPHKRLHHIRPLNKTHFDQWELLFITNVDEQFEGNNANLAKQRALTISGIIKEIILKCQQEINKIY